MYKKFLLSTFAIISLLINSAEAAFDKNTGAPKILLAEVAGYGQFELKPEFMANFYDVIWEIF